MPIYEYVCRDCGQRFEKLVRSWGETVVCPSCRAQAVEKQVSSFAFAGGGPAGGGGACGCGRAGCGCGH